MRAAIMWPIYRFKYWRALRIARAPAPGNQAGDTSFDTRLVPALLFLVPLTLLLHGWLRRQSASTR